MASRGLYRKLKKKICKGCDHPTYAPCKSVNPNCACKKCRKNMTHLNPRYKWGRTKEAIDEAR